MMSLASVIIRNPGADFRTSLPVSSHLSCHGLLTTTRQRFSPQREAELLTQFVHRVAEVMGSSSVTPK